MDSLFIIRNRTGWCNCLLYTSDAADERSSVDLGGRRIIKKKNNDEHVDGLGVIIKKSHDITTQTEHQQKEQRKQIEQ